MFVEEITARSCENMTYAMTNLKKKNAGAVCCEQVSSLSRLKILNHKFTNQV